MRRRGQTAGSAWLRVAACLVAVGAAGAAAAPADAYTLLGQRWPGTTIRYHNLAPSYEWSLRQAVQAWNTSGTRLRFVKSSQARAHVVIRATSAGGGACWGNATAGFVHPAFGKGRVQIARSCGRFVGAGVLAHELGHVLGLGHEDRRCATMNSVLWARCPDSPPAGQWRCRLVERDDVRGAVRRYGGFVKPVGPLYCWKSPPPPAPGSVTATSNPPGGADVLLRWKNTASAGLTEVWVTRGRDTCPTTRDGGDATWTESANAGATQTFEDFGSEPLDTGTYCYALWSYDEAGRTAGPTTVWVDHVDGFSPPTGLVALPNPAPDVFAKLTWTNSTHPRADFVLITRKLGSCPTDPYDDEVIWLDYIASGPPGAARSWEEAAGEDPGAWCYAVWSANDVTGRYSRTAATDFRD